MCRFRFRGGRGWNSAVPAATVLIGALVLSACSGGAVSGQAKDAPIRIDASQLSVTIENKAGLALQDVEVGIVPIGGGPAFTHMIGRMDAGDKTESSVDEFRDRTGMRLSLRMTRPRAVRVTAKDLNGKNYNVEVPWR